MSTMAVDLLHPRFIQPSKFSTISGRFACPPVAYNRSSASIGCRAPRKVFHSFQREVLDACGVLQRDKQHEMRQNFMLLDVSGMTCGACALRIKSILCSDERVDSSAVNILSETVAIQLKKGAFGTSMEVADDLARQLTEAGFPAKRREIEKGIGKSVQMLKEIAAKKKLHFFNTQKRLVFALSLATLCCVSHASHILHAFGIHVGHGSLMDFLHNPYVKCVVASISLLGPGRDLLLDGLRAFAKGSPNMNSLVGVGSIAAFLISAMSLAKPELHLDASFLDEPVMLLGFVLLGHSLEERARLGFSSDMIEFLQSLALPSSRLVVTACEDEGEAGDVCVDVCSDNVRIGDSILVLPGELIPLDGRVLSGKGMVDEFVLTGNSLPVLKGKNSMVYAGTLNQNGSLRIEVSELASESTVSKIIWTVQSAQCGEVCAQRLADSFAGYLVYSVIGLATSTFLFWYYMGVHIFPDVLLNDISGPQRSPFLLSLKLAVDVLVASCPCALGLAAPTATMLGISIGAKRGILLKGGDVMERLAEVDTIALDKTGILTEGIPAVIAVVYFLHDELEMLKIAAAVEKNVPHAVAKAIQNKAEILNINVPTPKNQHTEPGIGSHAEVDGVIYAVGSMEWVQRHFPENSSCSQFLIHEEKLKHMTARDALLVNGLSIVYVGSKEGVLGAIAVSDNLRSDAQSTIARLQMKGLKFVLLSCDEEEQMADIALKLGLEDGNVIAGLSPQQKSETISRLQAEGSTIAMVGNGIKDALCMSTANVGISVQVDGKVTAASDTASVILLGNKFSQIVDAIDLARITMSKVHQNLLWSIVYNAVAIPIASGILLPSFDFALSPSMSGGLMAMSSFFVITNSLLLHLHSN